MFVGGSTTACLPFLPRNVIPGMGGIISRVLHQSTSSSANVFHRPGGSPSLAKAKRGGARLFPPPTTQLPFTPLPVSVM